MGRIPELGLRDVGICCVVMPSVASVLLSTRTGGIEVSPPGPNIYNDIYSFRTFSFPRKITEFHTCIKKQLFRKINPKPSLALPHVSK